jgi:hypothetical protein
VGATTAPEAVRIQISSEPSWLEIPGEQAQLFGQHPVARSADLTTMAAARLLDGLATLGVHGQGPQFQLVAHRDLVADDLIAAAEPCRQATTTNTKRSSSYATN